MEQPLVPLVLSFLAGITTGSFLAVPRMVLLAGFLSSLVLLLLFRIRYRRNLFIPFLLAAFYLLGMLSIGRYLERVPPPDHVSHFIGKGKITLEGVISDQPKVFPDRAEVVVSADRITREGITTPVQGLVLLSLRIEDAFRYGDYLLCHTSLRAPRNFNNPGGYDYERSLLYRNILARGFIKDSSEIILLREHQGSRFRSAIENIRQTLKDFIRTHAPSPQGELIAALALGEQQGIPRPLRERFNMTGTSHILAISGFHVGMIAALSLFFIGSVLKLSEYLLLRINGGKTAVFFALGPVIAYVFIAGMSFSAIRATIMTAALLTAILLRKGKNHYNLLALAALLILVVSPPALFDVSFQLSFAAVAALLILTPRLTGLFRQYFPDNAERKSFRRRCGAGLFLFVAVTLAATLGTLPLVAFYFNRVSTIVVLANLLVVPLLGMIALPLSLAVIVAYPLSQTAALLLLKLSSLFVTASLTVVDYLAAVPGGSFLITTPTLAEILVYYLLLFFLMQLIDLRLSSPRLEPLGGKTAAVLPVRIGLVLCVLFFVLHGAYLHVREKASRSLRLTAIDVGQGSSTLIEFPGGRKMLLDGGGAAHTSFDMGRYVVARFLWQRRIGRVDVVVLSHPHPDHLQGLIYILDNFPVGEVWTTGQASREDLYAAFLRIIHDRGITHRIVAQTTILPDIGGVKISILNPPVPSAGEPDKDFKTANDASLVMRLTLGDVGFLLAADIAQATETRLVREQALSPSAVLWSPHHGGFSSSTVPFLRRVSPRIVLISCGAGNTFGDPHPDVLRRYRLLEAQIFRTDEDGAVTFTTDGRTISARGFLGRKLSLLPGKTLPE